MRFFCLCMSPAIDALVRIPSAPLGRGEIVKDIVDEENVGGKALNVARWLALRGADVTCGGLLGKDNAALFETELVRCGIADGFLRVAGSTRRNEVIRWPGGSFKINRAAFPQEDLQRLEIDDLLVAAALCDVAILSGSLPKRVSASFYADCIAWLRDRGVKTVLDASGEALRHGIKAHPDLIKPNAEECEPLVGFVPKKPKEFCLATEILRKDCAHVIISDGGAGAWFDGECLPAPAVESVDTTSAGDTMLAEWCWRRYGNSEDFAECGEWAVAAGSAACTMPGSRPPSVETVSRLRETLRSAVNV